MDGKDTSLSVTTKVLNKGDIKVTNNATFDPPTMSGNGKLEVLTGSQAILGSYTMNKGGSLTVDSTSLLKVAGDWSNELAKLSGTPNFQVNGTVELDGAGTLQHIEVAGKDFGNTLAANTVGFDNNFAIGSAANPTGTLQIDSGSNVMLVDQTDNGNRGGYGSEVSPGLWTGSPTGSEALYVWNLVIGNDVTIDLDGLHLYYEAGHLTEGIDDTFIGGEPIPVPFAGSVPEPPTFVLMAIGLVCLVIYNRIRRKSRIHACHA